MSSWRSLRRVGRPAKVGLVAAATIAALTPGIIYAGPANAAASVCTLTALYPVAPTNGLDWSHTYEYWYTQGTLYAGNCGAVWTTNFGVNQAGNVAGQSVKYRLRTYDSDGSIHADFPWTGCISKGDRVDVRATAAGDISFGRGFRVYARDCTPFYDSAGYRPGFDIHAGSAV